MMFIANLSHQPSIESVSRHHQIRHRDLGPVDGMK
jgi:hypothetical protein